MEPQEMMDATAGPYLKEIDAAMADGETEIQKFYKDTTLFLTGGTGFLGKQLIEKLFRCSQVKKAYILIRPKKGKAVQERLNEILKDEVFKLVRKKRPDFDELLVAVEGDVEELNLGIKEEDRKIVTDEVNIIFNMAATIRFDEKVKKATLVNVRGTRETVKLARDCKHFRCFVHISTAYSHATCARVGGEVKEEFYQSPIDPGTLISMAEKMDSDRLDVLTESLIKDWPNTYTFSKAVAEEVIRTETKGLCVAIVRPSIVLCSCWEPEPGWLDYSCMYGPSGVVLGVALGLIRVFRVNSTSKLSFVPVDLVNNATIAAAWDAGKGCSDVPNIYNVSSTNCGVSFRSVSVPMRRDKIRSLITPKAIWYCYLIETNNQILYFILSWLLHFIPAYIADFFIKIFNIKTPKEMKSLVDVYTKIEKLRVVLDFFLVNEWNFDDKNLASLSSRMSERDRKIYNFNIASIDWDSYTLFWVLSLRKYVLKDGFKRSQTGVRNQMYLKLANYFVIVLYIYVFWKMFQFVFGLF